MLLCYRCQNTIELEPHRPVSRHDHCQKCYADIRCCKNCLFYDLLHYNECKESMAERLTDKEKANFCGYFQAADSEKSKLKSKDELIDIAASLFKK